MKKPQNEYRLTITKRVSSTDPDRYMRNQERKFWAIGIFMAVVMASFWMIIMSGVVQVGKQVERDGGLGSVIGRFLQDVQNPKPMEEPL